MLYCKDACQSDDAVTDYDSYSNLMQEQQLSQASQAVAKVVQTDMVKGFITAGARQAMHFLCYGALSPAFPTPTADWQKRVGQLGYKNLMPSHGHQLRQLQVLDAMFP